MKVAVSFPFLQLLDSLRADFTNKSSICGLGVKLLQLDAHSARQGELRKCDIIFLEFETWQPFINKYFVPRCRRVSLIYKLMFMHAEKNVDRLEMILYSKPARVLSVLAVGNIYYLTDARMEH